MSLHKSWLDVLGDPIRILILECLVVVGEASAGELSKLVDASEPALRRHLETMCRLGIVVERQGERDGLTPGRPATRFRIRPEARERAVKALKLMADPLMS